MTEKHSSVVQCLTKSDIYCLWPCTHCSEVILELVRPASSGAERCVQAGEVLVAAHLDETGHGLCWETDEVQIPRPAAHGQVPQLQVDVTDACFT